MKNLKSAIGAGLLALSLAACSSSGGTAASGDEELIIALPAPNAVYWAVYAGMDQGWFEEEGFQPEVVSAQGSAGAVQQVAAGSAHLAGATPDAVVNAVVGGADVSMLAACINQSALTLIGQPEVTDIKQLEGQVIGVSAIKGGEITLMRMLLEQHGLSEGDYDVVVSGTTPAKVSALESDSVAAAMLFSPSDFSLERDGYTRLGSTIEVPIAQELPLVTYAASPGWIEEDDTRTDRLRSVLEKANSWLSDPANKDEAIDIFAEASGLDPEDVASTYELWFEENKLWPDGAGVITEAQASSTLEMMQAADELDQAQAPAVEALFIP